MRQVDLWPRELILPAAKIRSEIPTLRIDPLTLLWSRCCGGEEGNTSNGSQFTVVGVTPADFSSLEAGGSPDICIPMMMEPTIPPRIPPEKS